MLYVKLLGPPRILSDGNEVHLPYKKAEALLYYLLVKKKTTRSELVDILWAETDSAAALKNLRHAVYSVRKAIGSELFTGETRASVALDESLALYCDVDAFLSGDINAYSGEFLEGFSLPTQANGFCEWAEEERRALQQLYLRRLLSLEREAFGAEKYEEAERYGLAYLKADPLEENAVVLLMQVYSAQQKYRKAIDLYHELCRRLLEEFGISPLKETVALYYEIIEKWNTSTFEVKSGGKSQPHGKNQALRRLMKLSGEASVRSAAPLLVIQGVAGVGKTFLIDYILHQEFFPERRVLYVYCHPSESHRVLAPWNSVMVELLAEISRRHIQIPESYLRTAAGLFPCISIGYDLNYVDTTNSYPLGVEYRIAQESALEILTLAAKSIPLLLIFEDIHWMDPASAELLHALLRRLHGTGLFAICSCRDSRPAYIDSFIRESERDKLTEVCTICDLTLAESRDFIRAYLHDGYSDGVAQDIFQHTNGNPLLLVQLLNSLDDSDDPATILKSTDNIISARLAGLTNEERHILDAISVFDGWVPLEMLSSILSEDELKLMYLCDTLRQRAILTEVVKGDVLGYMFSHEKIKSVLSQRQSNTSVRILHLRAAQYMESQNDEKLYEQIIYHYTRGGNRLKAFAYRVRSLDLFAGRCYELLPILSTNADLPDYDESGFLPYFDRLEEELRELRAVSFGQDDPLLDELEQTLLYAESRFCVHSGFYDRALQLLARLLSLSEKADDALLTARVYLQYVYYGVQIYDIETMRAYLEKGMLLLDRIGNCAEYGSFLRLTGLMHLMRGEYETSRDWMERSILFFHSLSSDKNSPYAINIAGAYCYIAETYRLQQDYERAFYYYDQAIVYNTGCGYYPGAAIIYTDYGVAAFQQGYHDEARQLFERAYDIYQAFHEFSQLPIALSYLAWFRALDREYGEAAELLRRAFAVAENLSAPWWMGISIYMSWHIRCLLEERHDAFDALTQLWPAQSCAHIEWGLTFLHRLERRIETAELEAALQVLAPETENGA